MKRSSLLVLLLTMTMATSVLAQEPRIQSPSGFLDMEIGSDGVLADYGQITSYFEMLAERSERVELVDLGETTLGDRMIMAAISSGPNIKKLDQIRQGAHMLADPRLAGDRSADSLIAEGKTVVLVTCNIHSTEIGSSQMAMVWAHQLATAPEGSAQAGWLDDVVLLLVPSLNPDGQKMVVDWYREMQGSDFEGGSLPRLYHHYVGHDNNRDWFMLTQKETRGMTRALYHEWFPQIFVDHHQMGSTGPRMFIPPFSDPLDPDIHPLIWREIQLIGTAMAFRLEQEEKSGVIYDYGFDAYWMGGTRNTGWWKNVTGLLTETASARIATPIYIHPTELSGGRKGLLDYKPQVNFPNPWKGGWWRLRDIIEYQLISSNSLLETASVYRQDFLRNLLTRARASIELYADREAYFISRDQRNWPSGLSLARLMADHGVDVFTDQSGSVWIPLAQPYSRFVAEILEPQEYLEIRKASGADPLSPYDVSTWSLPLMMNAEVVRRKMPFDRKLSPLPAPIMGQPATKPLTLAPAPFYGVVRSSPEAAKVINAIQRGGYKTWTNTKPESDAVQAPVPTTLEEGTVFFEAVAGPVAAAIAAETGVGILPISEIPRSAVELGRPRVAIYRPTSLPSMDEGWTRFILENYGFEVRALDAGDIKGAVARNSLRRSFDVLILPDINSETLATGERPKSDGSYNYFPGYPEQYSGGLGSEGEVAISTFVKEGGTLIALNDSTDWVLSNFKLPVRNAVEKDKDLSSPGAILRVNVDQGTPLSWGLAKTVPIFHDSKRAFQTQSPASETNRIVIAWFPERAQDIRLSGWISGEEALTRKSAAVALEQGKGKIVLFGFRPQHRAQTHGTYPFLFNAIYWATTD